jgi:outer membrane protein assembly factor BamB
MRRAAWAFLVVMLTVPAGVAGFGPVRAAAVFPDWPTFLQNPSRTGATSDPKLSVANASSLKLKWAYQTGGPIATSPTIVATTAYVGSWDGNEYALNTATGALVWKQNLGTTVDPACNPATIGVTSSATVSNGVLYVGGGDAYWYALDAGTGNVLWKVYTGDNSQVGAHYNWSSPLIANGSAYIGVASNCDNPLVQGHLMKVDLTTHQVVGDYNFVPNGQLGGGVWTSPAFDPATNTVFVTTGTLNDYTQKQSQAIVALDGATLAYKGAWQLPFEAAVLDSDWGTSPTLTTDTAGDQLVSAANKNGIVYAFNRNNLAAGPIWKRQIAIGGDCPTCGDGTIASGVFANGVLYYAGGNNVLNGHGSGGSISALDPATGGVFWAHQTEQAIIGAPAYVNGMIGEAQGKTFEVLNAGNGALLYSYLLPKPVYGAVSVARSQFYVGAVDTKLYAFGIGASIAPPPDPNCPASFTCQDIRNPGVAGSEKTSNGVLTVTAAGAAIHGTSDQFRFISQPVTGDSQMSARILSQSTQNTQPQAGVMVRQSTDPTAPFFAILAYPNDLTEHLPQPDLVIWYRSAFGKNSIELTKWYPANKPVSVMVQRTGNLFSAGISFDGVNYQLIPGATVDLDLPATTLQGIAVDSGAANNTGTASFSNISVGGPVSTTMTAQAPADPCPQSWACQDIGNPNPPGDTTASGSSFTLAGTGTGIGGTADSFHYVYRSVSGNQALSAQVVTQTGSPPTAQEGLMLRANATATSPYYGVFLNPGGSATVLSRVYDGISNRAKLPLPNTTSPAYLKIVRYQDTRLNPPVTFFSAMTSGDGTTWTSVLGSTVAIDMGGGPYLAGMAATAAAPRVTPTVVFNNVTISTPSGAPPNICPTAFTCADIGTDIVPGDQIYLSSGSPTGTWTFDAAGADIWSVYDSFRFAYENFPNDPANAPNGDGTISVRVASQANPGSPWMKSGVMIRAGADPQAPYYGVFVTPGNGIVVQWRPTQAAPTNQVRGGTSVTAPVFVLASRYTDTVHNVVYYSAYTSSDGNNFTYVPGSTVALNLPGPLVAGIATDSHNSAGLAVSTFDNLAELGGSQTPPAICPNAWTCADIGGALPPGQDSLSNGTWNEVGGGGDIWTTADAFHFVSQALNGDGTVAVHVTGQQATNPWAKAGPMLRAGADPGSPYYGVFVTPGNGIAVQWRAAQGATTNQLLTPGSVPAYLMAARYTTSGANPQTYYTAYTSPDGITWTPLAGSTIPLNLTTPLMAGFAITSHSQGTGSTVTLDSAAVASTASPPPGVCPRSWQCADIGAPTPAGGQDFANGTWTVRGGGGDVWGTVDAFHFVWQSLNADGRVSAQVSSQTPSDVWAKAGVMTRASTDPGSPYYAVFQTPGNGIVVQSRDAQGNTTVQKAAIAGAPPVYVQVSRSGTTFTAATSPDGVNWTPLPNSATSLPNLTGSLLTGVAVTSHNPAQLSTVAFNSVLVG